MHTEKCEFPLFSCCPQTDLLSVVVREDSITRLPPMPTYTKEALAVNKRFRELMSFKKIAPTAPTQPIRYQIWSSQQSCKDMYDSIACEEYVSVLESCKEGVHTLYRELGDSRNYVLIMLKEDLTKIDELGSGQFDGKHGDELSGWFYKSRNLIVGGTYLGGKAAKLAEIFLFSLAAGWIPLAWVGDFPKGYLGIFPIPGRSAQVPKERLISEATASRTRPEPAKAIAPSSLPTVKIATAPRKAWDEILGLSPASAVRAALGPLVVGGGAAGSAVVKRLSKAAVSVTRAGSVAKPCLALTFTTSDGGTAVLSCNPPWTKRIDHLPPSVAQVLRHYNGMKLSIGAPPPRWHVYDGPGSGFAFDWKVWEINDPKSEPTAWRRKPLAPFSNGQDLWVCHPARKQGKTLALVKLDHESDTWEDEPQQHAGVRFLNIVAVWCLGRT